MTYAKRKLRSPLKWHGGKAYLARRIIALFPPHRVYVEPFAGGLNVMLNKLRVEREVAGDLNAGLVGFWMVLRDQQATLQRHLDDVPYRQEAWDSLPHADGAATPLARAVRFMVRNRFSRGGLGKDFAWSDRLRGGQPGDVNAWETIRVGLGAISERIKCVEFNCCDAVQLLGSCGDPDALAYLDPPYLPSTRTVRKAYEHEMTRQQHEGLLAASLSFRGAVFLSGYRNDLYDTRLAGWERHEFDMPNHSGQGKTKNRRVECVWTNA